MIKKNVFLLIGAMLALLMSLAACGNTGESNGNVPAGDFNTDSQATCFTQLSPEQRTQLQQYAAQQGDKQGSTTANADGTQNICVLENDGNGGYNEHYYKQEEQSNFDDYVLYSLLMGHSNTLLTYGLLSGDLDVGDAMALSLLTGVNNQGQMFHPYSYDNSSRRWDRTYAPVSGALRNVTYGAKAAPRPVFDNSKMLPVPPEFQRPLPPVSDKVVEFTKSSSGKVVKKSEKATGAKDAIKTHATKLKAANPNYGLNPVKSAPTRGTTNSGGSSGISNGTNKSKTNTAPKRDTPQAPKSTTSKRK